MGTIKAVGLANTNFTDAVTGMEFIAVKEGCFNASSTQVCVDAFAIGKYEVTQDQYQKIMGSNPSKFNSCGGGCPVDNISWDDAQAFISRLNSQSSRRYRLPSEAEWQYACTSGGKSENYCGGDNADAVAWYDRNSGSKTHRVGQKQPNGLGIYDMSGNVWEWIQDWYGAYPSSQRNPTGTTSGSNRVLRGGCWNNEPASIRASFRNSYSPYTSYSYFGFRLLAPVQ